MGLCQRQEAFRRAELHQPRKNVSAKGIVHPRHAFSVRKAARAPGAELDITVFVKDLFSEEPGGRRLPVADAPAPLDNDRAVAVFRQQKRSEHPAGTEAHDCRSPRKRLAPSFHRKFRFFHRDRVQLRCHRFGQG